MIDALNKLCKWRLILAGWHAGTKSIETDGAKAMRDLMEKWLIMRAENNAIATLMIENGMVTELEFRESVMDHALLLDEQLAKQFPGFETSEHGIKITDLKLAQDTMQRLGFPP